MKPVSVFLVIGTRVSQGDDCAASGRDRTGKVSETLRDLLGARGRAVRTLNTRGGKLAVVTRVLPANPRGQSASTFVPSGFRRPDGDQTDGDQTDGGPTDGG